jgi:hypothetical protein
MTLTTLSKPSLKLLLTCQSMRSTELRTVTLVALRAGDPNDARAAWLAAEAMKLIHEGERATAECLPSAFRSSRFPCRRAARINDH